MINVLNSFLMSFVITFIMGVCYMLILEYRYKKSLKSFTDFMDKCTIDNDKLTQENIRMAHLLMVYEKRLATMNLQSHAQQ